MELEVGQIQRDLTTVEAAELIGISPNLLRYWEQRIGFPTSPGRPGERRRFRAQDAEAVRSAIELGQSPSRAVSQVRRRTPARTEA